MHARRKVCRLGTLTNEALRRKLEAASTSKERSEAMLKDFHLVEAAMATDWTVASLDDAVRELLGAASERVGEVRRVTWVNPSKGEEEPILWIENGANADRERQLGPKQ